ncbi:MAG: PIN domain-containing protein [Tunicatimonas sp.]
MAKRVSSNSSKALVLCDSGVFFRVFRGDKTMWKEINHIGFDRLALSTVTKGEAYYGMKDSEVTRTKQTLNLFKHFQLNRESCTRFEQMMYEYRVNHPQLPDCMIAAVALSINAQLFTLNKKDFVYYEGLTFYKSKLKHSWE